MQSVRRLKSRSMEWCVAKLFLLILQLLSDSGYSVTTTGTDGNGSVYSATRVRRNYVCADIAGATH